VERFQPHIKNQLRKELVYDFTHNKERYAGWVDNPDISDQSWVLIKTLDSDLEQYKKHMIRMIHNTLPTKGKMWKRIKKEKERNKANETCNTFWQNKYPHIKNNKCTLCQDAEETSDHFVTCLHPFAKTCYKDAYEAITAMVGHKLIWFNCAQTNTPKELKDFPPILGSMGIMTKHIYTRVFAGVGNSKETRDAVLAVQQHIIYAYMQIWNHRNKLLFGKKHKGIT
jgi:ferredoxin